MRRFVLAVLAGVALAVVAPAVASAEPPHTHEILNERPSGFWTSNRPAVGGAYRYRLLGIGVVIAAGMGFLTYRLLKRASAARAEMPQARSIERR